MEIRTIQAVQLNKIKIGDEIYLRDKAEKNK